MASTLKKSGVISVAVMISRVLGLIREMIFGALFGAGWATDAFVAAFRAPNLLRDLFAEGALSQSFVTTFAKRREVEGAHSGWNLARRIGSLAIIGMILVSLIGLCFSYPLMDLLMRGRPDHDVAFATELSRIMWPFIALVSWAALVMGALNACHVYGIPALSSAFFNLVSIVLGVGLGWFIDPKFGPNALIGMAWGVTLGGLAQLAVQLPILLKQGFHWRWDFNWKDPGVAKIGALMVPGILAASATQINVMINTQFAALLAAGSMTCLNYAFRLMQLPIGVFGVATSTVTLTDISRQAARGDLPAMRFSISQGLRQIAFFTLPCAAILGILGEHCISVVYQYHRFGASGSLLAGKALACYAIGLSFYSGLKVLQTGYYALDKRKIPLIVALIAIGLNAALNYYFICILKKDLAWLALSTSVLAVFNFAVLYFFLARLLGSLESKLLLRGLVPILIGVILLVDFCLLGKFFFLKGFTSWNPFVRIFGLGLTLCGAGIVYGLSCHWTRAKEWTEALAMIKRRLGKKSASSKSSDE